MAVLNKQEFLDKIQEISNCEDDTQRRSLLSDLVTDGEETFAQFETSESERTKALEDAEKLRAANMKLFQRLGDHDEPYNPLDKDKQKEKRTFEDLFNEKGEIK